MFGSAIGSEMDSVREDDAILETVRIALGESGLARAAMGKLRRCSAIAESLDHTLIREHTTEVSIKHARVVFRDSNGATVDLDATIDAVEKNGHRTRAKVQGPVQLLREDGDWKVKDLTVDDVSLAANYFETQVSGSVEGLEFTVLGGRMFPEFVLSYVSATNRLDRVVTLRRFILGQRRTLLPGWRWSSAGAPIKELQPGLTRFDVTGLMKNAHAVKGVRLLVETDAGFVDARPESMRALRRIPLHVAYPWTWSSAGVAAVVVATGAFFRWWIAGVVLLQVAVVTLLSFQGHVRRGMSRTTFLHFCWTLTASAIGAALFFTHGGFGGPRGRSQRDRVSSFVQAVTQRGVVRADRLFTRDVGNCAYTVWDVTATPPRKWWVVTNNGSPLFSNWQLYAQRDIAQPDRALSKALAEARLMRAAVEKVYRERGKSVPPVC